MFTLEQGRLAFARERREFLRRGAGLAAAGWLLPAAANFQSVLANQAARGEWSWLEIDRERAKSKTAGTPLGLLDEVDYERQVVKLRPGDLVVLYSDGLSEATNVAGAEIGRDGLMDIASGVDSHSAAAFGEQLMAGVSQFRQGVEPGDDQTLIVLRAE